jgi:NADH-quinone oxidoreductase subunit F
MRVTTREQLKQLQESILSQSQLKPCVRVCGCTDCRARDSEEVWLRLKEALHQAGLGGVVEVKLAGSHGFCARGPLVSIHPLGIFYQGVRVDDVDQVVTETLKNGAVIEDLRPTDPLSSKRFNHEYDLPFYQKQQRVALRFNGLVDPTDIQDSIALGGYQSLANVLAAATPEEVIGIVERSGLRGRGGAGFPTGKKWRMCRAAPAELKYIICNGDEGDPGAYMDRSLLEGNPHSVIEGMIIGGYAIGATEGFMYIREEYPLAVKYVRAALEQAREYGFLGRRIFGSDFSFDIYLIRGAGAFVAGEETALIAAIEGRRSEPRQRPPYPVECGLWGKPTVINNVETWANVPVIIERGPEWYASIGTRQSKGTKIFSLVGKINNTGLVEVPMGITLREIVYDIGGGIPDGRELKAIQIGGPSGGCIPKELVDLPVDYESLTSAGAMMGSGGLIVMDDRTCMVDVAKYFTDFLRDESCGKCLPCREGTYRMHEILTDICEGKATEEDLDLLEELAYTVKDTSMCGLGQTASNPVLSTLRYFRHEYEAHIRERKCPGGVCKTLIRYLIMAEKCTGCLACIQPCPQGAITGELKKPHALDQTKCIKCGICYEVCNFKAIEVV